MQITWVGHMRHNDFLCVIRSHQSFCESKAFEKVFHISTYYIDTVFIKVIYNIKQLTNKCKRVTLLVDATHLATLMETPLLIPSVFYQEKGR